MKTFAQPPRLLPDTLFARAVFLLFCVQCVWAFVRAAGAVFCAAAAFWARGGSLFERFGEICRAGLARFLLESFFSAAALEVSIFLSGGLWLAAIWLALYACLRFARNRQPAGADFFWVSVLALAAHFFAPALSASGGGFCGGFWLEALVFAVSAALARAVFKSPLPAVARQPKVYLRQACARALRSGLFCAAVAAYAALCLAEAFLRF